MGKQDEILAQCAPSYPAMFRNRVSASPNRLAFLVPPEEAESTQWTKLTWTQTRRRVDELAAGLLSLGLQPEQRVAIACSTRIEWVLADLAIASAGGATTTVYPSTHAEDEEFILVDSDSVMVFVEDTIQLEKVLESTALDEQIKHIIIIDDDRTHETEHDPRVLTYADLAEKGREFLKTYPTAVTDTIAHIAPDQLSTLIYTSGTTGRPKGVELLHRSWAYEGAAVESLNLVTEDDLLYLWLPLAHVFGRDLLSVQMQVGFSAAVDGRVDRIIDGLGQVQPTILVGVPRIFEKVRTAVITMNPQKGIKGRISRWAFSVGLKSRGYRLARKRMPLPMGVRYRIADKLVYSKLKARMGGRMRLMISGSAKLSRQVQEWFYAAGFVLMEGYGLTETAAIAFVDHPDSLHFGTVGKVLPGVEAKLADDGELLMRGPIVARGYHNLPDETAAAWVDGWFHTGDIGEIDADGYLTITDRKKDLIKTSNGKYVAPQRVENAIMANIPYVSQAVAIGEAHKYVVAIVALDPVNLQKWAERRNLGDRTYAELSQLPEIRKSIDRFMRRANERLEPWERVQKYMILDRELSLDAEELTPSLKVRRDVVRGAFNDLILDLYEDPSIPFLDTQDHAKVDKRAARKKAAKKSKDAAKRAEVDDESTEATEDE